MKLKLKNVFIGFLVLFFLFLGGCFNPISARILHARIKKGMPYMEAVRIIKNQTGISRNFYQDSSINVNIVGPVFLKNTFTIYFSNDGRVTSKTDVKHWD